MEIETNLGKSVVMLYMEADVEYRISMGTAARTSMAGHG